MLSRGAAQDSAARDNAAPPEWLPALIYTADAAGEALRASSPADARHQSGNGAVPQRDGTQSGTKFGTDGGAHAAGADAGDGAVQLRHGRVCAQHLKAQWSEYYKSNPREPGNTQLAPWVEKAFQQRRQRRRGTAAGGGTENNA